MIELGADPNAKDNDGKTAYDLASEEVKTYLDGLICPIGMIFREARPVLYSDAVFYVQF